MSILSKNIVLYSFLASVSIFSWLISIANKKIVTKVDSTFMNLFTLIIGLLATLVYNKNSNKNFIRDFLKLSFYDILALSGGAIFVIFVRIMNTSLLKHHDVTTMQMTSYIMTSIINGGISFYLSKKPFSFIKILSYLIMCISGYIYTIN